MKITFKQEQKEKLTFGQVKENQFFVDSVGYLFQKSDVSSAACIAKPAGEPHSFKRIFRKGEEVSRILPEVEKIEF